MKKIVLISYLLVSSVFLIHSQSYETIKIEITKNLRCLVCQGQSIYDSDSEFANSIKSVVDKKLNEGSTKKEIYEFLKIKYGDWILYDPQFDENTYFLWLLPILMFILGGAIIFMLFIKKKN